LAIGIKRKKKGIGQSMSEQMDYHPKEGEAGNVVASLRWIREQEEEAKNESQGEPSHEGDVAYTRDLDTVVVENGVTAEELSSEPVTEAVDELGKYQSESCAEG
jgi:hypothetical protein